MTLPRTYVGVRTDRRTGRFQARVQVDGVSHDAGRWPTRKDAALARDRLVLFLGLDTPLNIPIEARRRGVASAEQLRREAVDLHRRKAGRTPFIGLRKTRAQTWTAFVVLRGEHINLGALSDALTLAMVRDRVRDISTSLDTRGTSRRSSSRRARSRMGVSN